MKIPKLMLITEGTLETTPLDFTKLSCACQQGVPAIQLREKHVEARTLWEAAVQLRQMTAHHGVFFSINDRIDIALAVQADGVHLSEMGLSPNIPKKLNSKLLVGVSVHSIETGLQAEQEGADYVLFGPVFDTPAKKAQGLESLTKIARALSIPVLAVGGIIAQTARKCLAAGAYGVAAIRVFAQTPDIRKTTQDFQEACI